MSERRTITYLGESDVQSYPATIAILMLGGFWVGGWCTLLIIRTLMEFKAWQNCFVLMYHFLDSDSFYNCIASCYHISLVNVTTNYCSNILILVVKQLNKIIKCYHFKKHCGMARVELRCVMGCPGLKSSYREKVLSQHDRLKFLVK